jgi:hypothetical protein
LDQSGPVDFIIAAKPLHEFLREQIRDLGILFVKTFVPEVVTVQLPINSLVGTKSADIASIQPRKRYISPILQQRS